MWRKISTSGYRSVKIKLTRFIEKKKVNNQLPSVIRRNTNDVSPSSRYDFYQGTVVQV